MEEKVKTNQKTRKKKKLKNTRLLSFFSLILSVCMFAASAYFMYRTASEVYTMVVLQKEISVSEEVLRVLEQETAELKNEKTKLEDPKYVTRYARGQYLLTKDGEKVFYLPSK